MSFKAADMKTIVLMMVAMALMGALFYAGEKIPGIEQIREGWTD